MYDLIETSGRNSVPSIDDIKSGFNDTELIFLVDDATYFTTNLGVTITEPFKTWTGYVESKNTNWRNVIAIYNLSTANPNRPDYSEALGMMEYHFSFDKHLSTWCGHKDPDYVNAADYPPFDINSCVFNYFNGNVYHKCATFIH